MATLYEHSMGWDCHFNPLSSALMASWGGVCEPGVSKQGRPAARAAHLGVSVFAIPGKDGAKRQSMSKPCSVCFVLCLTERAPARVVCARRPHTQ